MSQGIPLLATSQSNYEEKTTRAIVVLNKLLKVRRVTVPEYVILNEALMALYDEVTYLHANNSVV